MSSLNDEFPHIEGLRYLNHAAVAPWPRRATEAVSAFAQQNMTLGARDYPQWLTVENRLRVRLARLLNAPASADIALVKNTSEALSFVAFGLDWNAGDQIIISDEEFPSNRVVWEALRPRGVEVIQVSLKGDDPEAALLAACGPKVRLMAISAVQYASGLRLDLPRLGEGCERHGVLLCIDAIQQLGALPFDVQQYRCAWVFSTAALTCASNCNSMSTAGICSNMPATMTASIGSQRIVRAGSNAAAPICSAQWRWRQACRYWRTSVCPMWVWRWPSASTICTGSYRPCRESRP